MCSFFLLFLSFPLLGANVNAKKRRETTSTRRERRRERKKSEDACGEDDGRRSCGDDKRIGENNERHWGKRSSPSDKARRLDAFCVENYAFLCTGTCIVDYARRVYIKPRADRGLKCQPRAGYLRRDRNKEGGSARDESPLLHTSWKIRSLFLFVPSSTETRSRAIQSFSKIYIQPPRGFVHVFDRFPRQDLTI